MYKRLVGGRALTNVPKAEYVQTIEADDYDQSTISDSSDIALRAAIKLYAPDHETAQTAFEQIKAYQKKQMRE